MYPVEFAGCLYTLAQDVIAYSGTPINLPSESSGTRCRGWSDSPCRRTWQADSGRSRPGLSTPRSSGPPNRTPQIAAPAGPSAYGDHRPSSHSRPREAIPRGNERRESAILAAMITVVVRQSGFSKQTAWWSKTRDVAPGQLVPADIEGGELREKLQLAVRQMVVDPPRHRLPRNAVVQAVDQSRHDDAGHRSHAAVLAALVPDMPSSVALIRTAVLKMRIPVRIDLR